MRSGQSYDLEFARSQLAQARALALTHLTEPVRSLALRSVDRMLALARAIEEQPGFKPQESEPDPERGAELDEACRKPEEPLAEMRLRVFLAYVVLEVRKSGSDVFTRPETEKRVIACLRHVNPSWLVAALPELPDSFRSRATEGDTSGDGYLS